jgi:hypothetical protein
MRTPSLASISARMRAIVPFGRLATGSSSNDVITRKGLRSTSTCWHANTACVFVLTTSTQRVIPTCLPSGTGGTLRIQAHFGDYQA